MKTEKYCNGCNQTKPACEFSPRIRNGKTILRARCRPCETLASKAYRKANPEWWKRKKAEYYERNPQAKNFERWRRFAKKNGISPDAIIGYVKSHNGLCDICGEESKDLVHPELHLDHCHATGNVRGRLCNRCNAGLGQFRDSPELLIRAIEYLKQEPVLTKVHDGPLSSDVY